MDLKNKHTATIITVVMIVLSILLGNSLSINKHVKKVSAIYSQQILPELQNQANYTGQLIQFSKDRKADQSKIDKLQATLDTFNQTNDIEQKYDAFMYLQDDFRSLHDSLMEFDLTQEQDRTLNKINQQFHSCHELIMRSASSYNELAIEVNEDLSSFPLSITKHLVGKGNIPLFM